MPLSTAAARARDATTRRALGALATLAAPTKLAALALALAAACRSADPQPPPRAENPPAVGFDLAGSDARALQLADACMRALGGRRAWDETRYIAWRSFGARLHVWDKASGDLRIEAVDRTSGAPMLTLMNVHTRAGRAWRGGRELAGSELASALAAGHASFANDSDWMFLPYKLKDAGVTLRYEGRRPFGAYGACEVLSLRRDAETHREAEGHADAEGVKDIAGNGEAAELASQHRFEIALDPSTRLVRAWASYARASDERPLFTSPWGDWRRYGRILLSADRGPGRVLSDIGVYERLPEAVFRDPAPIALAPHAAR